MNLKNDVARLERAGAEYSVWIEKLRVSVDNLATYFTSVFPMGDKVVALPRNYLFRHWPGVRQYKLEKSTERTSENFTLTSESKEREALLKFAADVANGWLDDVAGHLQQEAARFKDSSEKIDQFVTS